MKKIGVIFIFLFLLPCLVTFLFGNLRGNAREVSAAVSIQIQLTEGRFQVINETGMGSESIPLELYVADKLARTMDGDWEMEALKTQAVLIRSGLLWEMEQRKEESKDAGILSDAHRTEDNFVLDIWDDAYGSVPVDDSVYQAVAETAGFCMTYQGNIVPGAYFAVSNGATRNGEELGLTEYPYLRSVLCSRDFLSEDYNSSVSLHEEEFARIWETLSETENAVEKIEFEGAGLTDIGESGEEISTPNVYTSEIQLQRGKMTLYRDSVGYILFMEWQEKCVSGEMFRNAYHVPSAGFHLSAEGKNIMIESKGAGHGLGLSQFTANEMAKEGKTCLEILDYFFKDVTITKIE